MALYQLAKSSFLLLLCFTISNIGSVLTSETKEWSKPALIYLDSYEASRKPRSYAIFTPQLVGNIVWTVQQSLTDGCIVYPMEILISSQYGALPWLNESAWSPELLILRRQRYAIRLDSDILGSRISFETMGGRMYYISVISLAPESSKLRRLGIAKDTCALALHFNSQGEALLSEPLLRIDASHTAVLRPGQLLLFRLALPQFAYSVRLDIDSCSSADCNFLAGISVGAPADVRTLHLQRLLKAEDGAEITDGNSTWPSRLFVNRLSPLSGSTYLSLSLGPGNAAPNRLLKLTFALRVHRSCAAPVSASVAPAQYACELYPMLLQQHSFYGGMQLNPTSPGVSGGYLRILKNFPVVIPFTVVGIVDSRRFLLIDIDIRTWPVALDFCLSRRLALGYGDEEKACEVRFDIREPGAHRRLMPRPPAGVWYLAIVNPQIARADVTLKIITTECPSECLKGGRCETEELDAFPVYICRCYDGFAGDLCENRVPVSPDPLAALLLLCLSNAAFLPTIVLACRRRLLIEALIYCMTMLASALYHACDNNYARQLCVLSFDTLGKLDFLGAFLSLWVTLLLLVELRQPLKQLVQTIGSLFLMIGVMVNRTSFVIIAVPLGIGFLALTFSWICRCYTNKRCYPPLRLVLTSLLPGGALALAGFAMFALLDTWATYFLVHSGWHCCIAFAIFFFLVPQDRQRVFTNRRSGVNGNGARNCGIDRCFVLGGQENSPNNEEDDVGARDGGSGGIKSHVEYSALPLVSTAESAVCPDDILVNGSFSRENSARSSSSSENETAGV